MSNGGYKGASPARETSPEQYPGVWELTEQFQAQAEGNWPFQADDCAPKSLRFNASDSAYLSKTYAAAGNRKTWTWSGWVKRGSLSTNNPVVFSADTGNAPWTAWQFTQSDGTIQITTFAGISPGLLTNASFRDPSAWYHIVIAMDTTQATASDRVKLYVNGEQQTFSNTNYPAQDSDTKVNGAFNHYIGYTTNQFFDGELSEVHLIDGQALSCEEFGFFDGQGIWQPKRFTGDYSSGPVYSNFLTSSGTFDSAAPPTGAFDGIADSSNRARGGTDDILTFDISSFGFTGLFEFWSQNSNAEFSIDGGSTWSAVGDDVWTTASTDITGVTSIKLRPDSGATMKVSAFRSQGQWLIDPSVGRNSFHLDFSDTSSNAALGKDSSGLVNNWTPNNLDHFTGVDPTVPANTYENRTLGYYLNGNPPLFLTVEPTGTNGINRADQITHGSSVGSGTAAEFAVNDVLQWAIDWSGGTAKIWFGRNNVWYSGDPAAGTNPAVSSVSDMNLFLALAYNSPDFQLQVPASPSYTMPTGFSYWGGVTLGTWKTSGTNQGACPDVFSTAIPRTGKVYIEGIIKGGTSTYACIGLQNHGETDREIDIFVDTPVNGKEASTGAGGERRGNYCTLNALKPSTGVMSISDGNLVATQNSGNADYPVAGTIFVNSGKWYWEVTINNTYCYAGIVTPEAANTSVNYLGEVDGGAVFHTAIPSSSIYDGTFYDYSSTASAASNGDTIGVSLNFDDNEVIFYINGVSQGVFGDNFLKGRSWTAGAKSNGTVALEHSFNFGQRPFKYPLSGFSPLATSFLPEPTIKRGDEAMDVALWTGNNSTNKIGNLRLSPDLVWIKARSPYALNHELYDTVRGAGNLLRSNTAGIEASATRFSSFDSDGFTLNGSQPVNGLNETHVSWVWDAGDSTTTIAAGSLNSSAYNTSQVWTNYSGDQTTKSPSNAFDGNSSTNFGFPTSAGNGNSGTFTFSITGANKIRIRAYTGYATTSNGGFEVNSVDIQSQITTTPQWITISGSSLSSIYMAKGNSGSGNFDPVLEAVEVDGKILVDSTATPSNVPLVATDVRARTDAGFSIAKWTKSANNQSYAHGLSQAPEFIIAKSLDGAHSWRVWHKDLANNKNLLLDTANEGETTYTDMIGIPDANQVPLIQGGPGSTNGGMIAYNYHSVEGYSAFGSFETNGLDDNAFIYTGFRARWIMWRRYDAGNSWGIVDTARTSGNVIGNYLLANDSAIEQNATLTDILSNGFKMRTSGFPDGHDFIYAAFAEHPFASNCRAR